MFYGTEGLFRIYLACMHVTLFDQIPTSISMHIVISAGNKPNLSFSAKY
jgi:hypothetical protein